MMVIVTVVMMMVVVIIANPTTGINITIQNHKEALRAHKCLVDIIICEELESGREMIDNWVPVIYRCIIIRPALVIVIMGGVGRVWIGLEADRGNDFAKAKIGQVRLETHSHGCCR